MWNRERLSATDWALVMTNDGKKYYYNTKTQVVIRILTISMFLDIGVGMVLSLDGKEQDWSRSRESPMLWTLVGVNLFGVRTSIQTSVLYL